MAKVDCSELAKTLTQLAMNLATDPDVKNLDDVVFSMQKIFPDIRRESLVDAINEATVGQSEQLADIEKKLLAIRQEARNDRKLTAKIDALKNYLETGKLPPKPKPKPAAPDAIVKLRRTRDKLNRWLKNSDPAMAKELSKRLDELNAITREELLGEAPDPKLHAEVQKIQDEIDAVRKKMKDVKAEAGLQEKVDTLQKHLEEGTLPEKQARKEVEGSEAATRLREIIADLRGKLDKSPPAMKAKLETQIKGLEEKLASGDILPRVKAKALPQTKELERLEYQRDMLRRKIRRQIEAMKPRSIWDKIADPFNAARSLITSLDLSAVGRQGAFIGMGNPARAAKSIGPMLKALASEQKALKIERDILARPNAPLYLRSKLYLAPLGDDTKLSGMEEGYMSKIAEKIPYVRASERAYITFLNKLRADSFDAMVAGLSKNGSPTQQEAEAVANFINIATGRGKLYQLEQAAVPLNTIFFAPRYVASRFQLLAGQPFYQGTMRTRRMIAKEYAKYLIGMGVVYGLAALAGAAIEWDPRSSDFGKIRFGRTRLDPLAGLSQTTVVVSRVATGKTKTQSGIKSIRGDDVPYGGQDAWDVASNFLRSKLSPMFSFGVNLAAGENVVGEEVTPTTTIRDLIIPLTVRDIKEAIQDQGADAGTAMGLLAIFGWGLQTYGEPQSQASRVPAGGPERARPERPQRPQRPQRR